MTETERAELRGRGPISMVANPRACNNGETGGNATLNAANPLSISGPSNGFLLQADPNNTATFTLNNTGINPTSNATIYLPAAKLTLNGPSSIKQPNNSPIIVAQLTLDGTSQITTKTPTIG